MTTEKVSDEMLMAFVDGELDARSAADLSAAIRDDPALSQRAEMFAWSRQAAKDAYAEILSEPVPAHLLSQVLDGTPDAEPRETGSVLAFRPRRRFPQPFALPLAACLALAVGLGGGYLIGDTGSVAPTSSGLIGDAPQLADAFATRASGPVGPIELDGQRREFSILGTYEVADGLCRAFQLGDEGGAGGIRGLACDRGAGYGVEMAVRDASGSGGFSPASNTAASSVDAYLEAMDASAPFDRAQEAEILGIEGAE